MKSVPRSLIALCLTSFCLLATSNLADAQITPTTPPSFQATSSPVFPKYKVMGVVYAPPGSASNVTYGNSNLVGSTDTMSTSNSSTNTVKVSVTAGFGIPLLFSATATYDFSDSWTESSEFSNSIAIQTTTGNSIATMGPISSSLGVDHDNDVIYIWLNPVLTGSATGVTPGSSLTWTGLASNSCDPNDPSAPLTVSQAVNGCDPNQYPYPDIVGIPVWCLKNPYSPLQGCAQWIPYTSRSWDTSTWSSDPYTHLPTGPGLTMRDYADILQADPFVTVNGNDVNVCHPTYGPSVDPNLAETIGQTPLTPTNGSTYTVDDAGVTSNRINYADPYDPYYYNGTIDPYNENIPQATGFFPNNCTTANTANVTVNSTTMANMNRFQPYGAVEYPVPGPNGLPSTYTGNFQYSNTQTKTTVATDSHTVSQGVSVSASVDTGQPASGGTSGSIGFIGSVTAGYSNSTTWQQQSTNANTVGSTASASYSITGPQLSDNYVGPATYNVYLDNVYGTYAFYSDLEQPVTPADLATVGITDGSTACSAVSSTPCGSFPNTGSGLTSIQVQTAQQWANQWANFGYNANDEQVVTLRNLSTKYPITLAGPAVTFSDPGFQVVEDGSDTCSNTQLTPFSTTNNASDAQNPDYCTLKIIFAPVPSDLPPLPIYNSTQTVNANIIAAGTINATNTNSSQNTFATSYNQNILVTDYGIVQGIAAPPASQFGATLYPANADSNVPNAYIFTTSSTYTSGALTYTPQTEEFVFTNVSNSTVTFPSYAAGQEAATDFLLTDSADFSVTNDNCNGLPVTPNTFCTFTLQYLPTTPSQSGVFATRITAISIGQGAIATAGATGTTAPALSVTSYYDPTASAVTMPMLANDFDNTYIYEWAEPITITNTTPGTVTFSTNNSPTVVQDPLGKNYTCEADAGTGYNTYFTDCIFTTSTTGATSTIDNPIVSPWGYMYGQLGGTPITVQGAGGQLYYSVTQHTIPGYSGGPAVNCYGSLGPGASCTAAVVAFLPATSYASNGNPRGWDDSSFLSNGTYQELGPAAYIADFNLILNAALTMGSTTKAISINIPVVVNGTDCNGTGGCPTTTPSVVITGSENSTSVTTAATSATGTITLSASANAQSLSRHAATAESRRRDSAESPEKRTPVRLLPVAPSLSQSTLSVSVGGVQKTVSVPLGTAINDAAAILAQQLNAAGSPVSAVANGSVVTVTSQTAGSGGNLPLSAFVIGEYQVTPSGNALTGGKNASTGTNYDSGSVQFTSNGITATVPWGSTSTPQSIAAALAASINQTAGAYWNANAVDNLVVLTSVAKSSTSEQPTLRRASTAARRALPEAARAEATTDKAEATTTSPSSNQIEVTVSDSAGFTQPSFSVKAN